MQYSTLSKIPSWLLARVDTIWAAWGTVGLALLWELLGSLLLALPGYFIIEYPLSRIYPRS